MPDEAAGLYLREAGLLAAMREVVADEPRPLLFATVSGAHLYGFPSQDSDVDLRGVHLMRTGRMLAHLPALAQLHRAPEYLSDLIEAKSHGEHRLLAGIGGIPGPEQLAADVARLQENVQEAALGSRLPAGHEALALVGDIAVRARTAGGLRP